MSNQTSLQMLFNRARGQSEKKVREEQSRRGQSARRNAGFVGRLYAIRAHHVAPRSGKNVRANKQSH